jgi:acetone carboxylase gamma subunit
MKVDRETLRDLVEERLPRQQVRAIQSSFKDPDRFDKYLALLQERVPWSDPIVLPFGDRMHIVAKPGGAHVVKCECGHEFCDYRQNWKLDALINVRETMEDLREIYPEMMQGDPEWNHLREFFCPGCRTLLEVEAVPPGYPLVHDFVPDLEGFYREWLGRDVPSLA